MSHVPRVDDVDARTQAGAQRFRVGMGTARLRSCSGIGTPALRALRARHQDIHYTGCIERFATCLFSNTGSKSSAVCSDMLYTRSSGYAAHAISPLDRSNHAVLVVDTETSSFLVHMSVRPATFTAGLGIWIDFFAWSSARAPTTASSVSAACGCPVCSHTRPIDIHDGILR